MILQKLEILIIPFASKILEITKKIEHFSIQRLDYIFAFALEQNPFLKELTFKNVTKSSEDFSLIYDGYEYDCVVITRKILNEVQWRLNFQMMALYIEN